MFKSRRYLIELAAALALYIALLFGSLILRPLLPPSYAARILLSLTPMLGMIAGAWVIIRELQRMDELQRCIQFNALAIAFTCTALFTFGWGFAELSGAPHLPTFAIWPLMATFWIISQIFTTRRYQ